MPADPSLLVDLPLFEALDTEERALLAEAVDVETFAAGQALFKAGEPGQTMFVVARGEGDPSLLPLSEIAAPAEGLRLPALLTAAGLTASNSEANRKLKERAVRIDAAVVEDAQRVFTAGFEGVLQVGKRNFARVRLTAG